MRGKTITGLGVIACIGVLALAGCGGSTHRSAAASSAKDPAGCPAAWLHGWQALANRIHAPVYCPQWMPQPLNGKIARPYTNAAYVNGDRSYLVSFIESENNPDATYEVHVNFRGYPGRTSIPVCEDTVVAGKKILRPKIPCFADPHGTKQFGPIKATVYTANQGVDTWHVLYAWRHDGSLYAVSEHVITPYTYRDVVANLDHIMKRLALVKPA